MTRCVYAFASPPSRALRVRGLRGETLMVVRRKAVAAIVGELRTAPVPTPRNLRAYHAVLQRLADDLPAMLPVRFGTVLPDLEELTDVLRARQRVLRRQLARVRRRVQMTVRFVAVGRVLPDAVGRVLSDPAERSADRSTGRAYLHARAAAAARVAQREECVRLRAAVSRWVRAERIETRAGVLTVYHLVPRAAASAYRRAVAEARWDHLTVAVGGPYPPFAFTGD